MSKQESFLQQVFLKPKAAKIEGDKRQHAPYVLHFDCSCGKRNKRDMSHDDYMSYPTFGAVNEYTLYCEKCEAKYAIGLKLTMSVEIAQPPRVKR